MPAGSGTEISKAAVLGMKSLKASIAPTRVLKRYGTCSYAISSHRTVLNSISQPSPLLNPPSRLLNTASQRHLHSTTLKMSAVPKSMRGIVIEETGDSSVLKWKTDLPVPELQEGQILVKNEWVGVNYIDTLVHLLS